MENQNATPDTAVPTAEEAAQKGVQNTLGVIKVVEGLFNSIRRGSYPLDVHEGITNGMNFLAQFHTQLVGQLPPGLVDELRKASQAPNVAAEAPKTEVPSEPVQA